ncbi:MAG: penicillin acylase family protein [Paracoccus sp. (in: a-proteobacteria)]|uniref:penicillin acylase family protein n=1 Tax=Paracoccus sp. TaxID=267 RepID=UPI0026DFD4AA|nr:penicillin acylase family protein [Paracoccus sp. (in: a-proteobacteria)]MDO5614282.1 penicillin acylase family protein [Paracoccus sp. (in: a-proteobacteria)]
MLTLFRWLLRITIGMIAAFVAATVLVWYFAIRSLPDYDSAFSVPGISAPVDIIRSTENVPHIFGQSDDDVFFALGLAHAQDRLFQMLALRRAAQGRLSEIYGERTLPADDLARRLGLTRLAGQALESQTPQARAALDAYARGVNEWIRQINEGARGRGAPEFFIYPGDIAYWQPADSLAILKLMAVASSSALADEVLRARLSLAAPGRGADLLAPPGGMALPDYAGLFPGARLLPPERLPPAPDRATVLAGFLPADAGLSASAVAIAPTRTAMGGAILANDPQGPLTAPGLWYLARLELSSGGVIGGTVPGLPLVLSGRNTALAWGITPAALDDTDVLIEEVQPGDSNRYRTEQGWTRFDTGREIIRVLDGQDRAITLRSTVNGPVMTSPALSQIAPVGHVTAISWTGARPDDASFSALLGLMTARDRSAAGRALAGMTAPALNVLLADQQGVGRVVAGEVPRRDPASQTAGHLPAPGWVPANRWQGQEPASQPTPSTTENAVVATTGEGAGGPRMARLGRLMNSREIHSRDSLIETQLDIVSPVARQLLPLVGAELWFTGEPAAPGTPERQRQDALGLLAEWDGAMSEHLPEPLIYAAWMQALQDRMIRDELGPLSDDIRRLYPAFIEAAFRNSRGAARWCDVVQSAPVEDCATLARQALDAAILDLSARFGPDVTSWRWGNAHEAHQINPALGGIPGLGWVVNLVQSTSGGDSTLALATSAGVGGNPWRQVAGAGYRAVYDLADPDSSVFVIATGQSGHPLSRHYDDMAGLWRRGEYVSMSLDPALARAAARGITRLEPAR